MRLQLLTRSQNQYRVVICALIFASAIRCRGKQVQHPRRTLSRPIPTQQDTCHNTAQGRWYLTDDRGWLCARDDLDWVSGCCSKGSQYTCDTCHLESQCCQHFESCVSCCLSPAHNASNAFQDDYRAPGRPETGRWDNAFDYCCGKCRTSSKSTVHENAYLDTHHHCFSVSGKPVLPIPAAPALPDNIKAVAGDPGESCTAACNRTHGSCAALHFSSLNNCNVLRQHFACEAGCENSSPSDHPSYVAADAPKEQQPTACLISSDTVQYDCDSSTLNVRRLCPCEAVGVLEVA